MADMQLTPIGTSPAWYNPGEPTSGFLLEHGDFRMLIDCGSGVLTRYLDLYGGVDAPPIDAVIITHIHMDHVSDLIPLKYGIDYGSLQSWQPQLFLPPGVHERLQTMATAWNGRPEFFTETFDLHEYVPGSGFSVGPFTVDACEMPHYIESCAIRVQADAASFGYSGDLGPTPIITSFMRGVDLFLCEATLDEIHSEPSDLRGHLTATEAGEIAASAGVHSLLLTHVPVERGQEDAVETARAAFGGPTALARSGETWAVAQRLARAV